MSNYTCTHCGRVLEPGEEYIFDEEYYCKDCLDEVTTTCDCCGRRIYTENDEGDSRLSLCDRCYRDFYTACDRCGRLVRNEDAYYLDEEDDTPYCHSCYESFSYIHHYHYKPDPIFYGDGDRFFGVELEVDCGGESSSNAKKILDIANESGDHLYCKHDGSLDQGFELVTHSMSLDFHAEQMSWQKILNCLKEMGYRSHQTSTAGLHIHVNRTSLGCNYQEQEETIARILYLVEKFWEELVKFSRRTIPQLNRWAARYGFKESPQDILKCAKGGYGRYACVNLCNEQTVEFRIFRGTLKYNSILAALQLVDKLCSVAFSLSDEEIRYLSWTSFVAGCTQPELIQYLKERRLYINEPVEAEQEV